MNKLLVVAILLSASTAFAQQLAFPTAEGYGRFATGGRGGAVIEVTNLNSTGPGSLRACLEASGPRTCVFRVAGIIDLNVEQFFVTNPNLTIAGQTAPGDGVLIKGMIDIRTDDVIIRHLRVRPGPNNPQPFSWVAINVAFANRVIVDHCSLSWSTDDTSNAWESTDVTYQWNIFAEGLNTSQYGKGLLVGETTSASTVTIYKNLFAHFSDRIPMIKNGRAQVVNNVIYNGPGNLNIWPEFVETEVELVGNYFLRGVDSDFWWSTTIRLLGPGWPGGSPDPVAAANSEIYLSGNIHPAVGSHPGLRPTNSQPETDVLYVHTSGGSNLPIVTTPLGMPALSNVTDAFQARVDVLANAGAKVPVIPVDDIRVVNDLNSGTGTIEISNPTYPVIPFMQRPAGYDTDVDGMPDTWETVNGLNPNDSSDGPLITGNGYSNLENYLNELAGDTVTIVTLSPPENLRIQ